MTFATIRRRAAAVTVAVGLALLLTGCLLSPGKFTSALDLRKDGSFTFSYQGEIYILGLGQLAEIGKSLDGAPEFVASPCFNDDEDYTERDCTEDELAQQRSDWDAQQQARKDDDERNEKAFDAMFGGIDPSDPDAAQEIAAKLQRQHGWNAVTYKGNGLYDVDFSVSSRLGHDFTFPTLEGFPMANFFVVANLRDGNVARIEAPGFSAESSGPSSGNGFLQMASVFGSPGGVPEQEDKLPVIDGAFTVTTDGEILANNTDEGPQAVPTGKQLSWKITRRSSSAPSALIRLGN
jgi:hypothetical protein